MADKYSPIGECIYCGKTEDETELKKEHIVPYSLAGNSFLPKSSCQECESITSAIEGKCVAKMYKLLRLRFDIQTRRRKKRIKSMPIQVILDGKSTIIDLPVNGLLGILGFVHFPVPGFLRIPEEHLENFVGTKLSVRNIMPKDMSIWEQKNISSVKSSITFQVETHALMMAKIAHCIAVGTFGINNFDKLLTGFILKQETKGLAYLVGGVKEIEPPIVLNNHHQVSWEITKKDFNLYYILIKIRLFSYLGGPTVQVIAGLTDESRLNKIKEHIKKNES